MSRSSDIDGIFAIGSPGLLHDNFSQGQCNACGFVFYKRYCGYSFNFRYNSFYEDWWAATVGAFFVPCAVAVVSNDKLRVCLDSQPLNKAICRTHYPFPGIEDFNSKVGNAKFFSSIDVKSHCYMVPLTAFSFKLCTLGCRIFEFKNTQCLIGYCCMFIEIELLSYRYPTIQTIKKFKSIIVKPGPNIVISDNGPPFYSRDFTIFCSDCGDELITSSPYLFHSDLGELSIQTVKN
uniref:Integrase catalytic domain-containing protein n=1 Tax=Glossina pallidipes TaxID=7398 RepID=A0A1A9ZMH6_GLOPL